MSLQVDTGSVVVRCVREGEIGECLGWICLSIGRMDLSMSILGSHFLPLAYDV